MEEVGTGWRQAGKGVGGGGGALTEWDAQAHQARRRDVVQALQRVHGQAPRVYKDLDQREPCSLQAGQPAASHSAHNVEGTRLAAVQQRRWST